ncbi:MAG: hypothetical protein ACXAB8_16595 [Promethearchaeota archaeon]|jgi:hypothetical protein
MVEKIDDYSSMTKEELIEYFERSLKLKDENITLKEKKLKDLERSLEELIYESSIYEFETSNLIKILRKENKQHYNQLEENLKFLGSDDTNILDLSEDLNNKDRINLLLKSEALTSTELADKLGLSKQDTRTYLLRLKKEKRVRVLAKKGRLNIYTAKRPVAIEKQDRKINDLGYNLSYLINLIEIKMKLKEGENLTPADTLIIKRIKDQILETRVDLLYGKDNLREDVNKKFANLEAKINQLTAEGASPQIKRKNLKTYQKHLSSKENLKKGQNTFQETEKLDIFLYNEKYQKYQKYEFLEEGKINELLNPDFSVLFVDPKRYRVWIWHGSNTTTRMKFISAKIAPSIRDRYGISFKISSVDEGKETAEFKEMIGMQKEIDYSETQTRPSFEITEEDLELLYSLSREEILLLLEKAVAPKGYERTENLLINEALKKIESIMEVESIDEIAIQRDYLLEIFDKRILKFSKDDGYPMIASWALLYFLQAGIDVKNFGTIIKFYKSDIKFKSEVKQSPKLSNLRIVERMNIQCQFCGYNMVKPFPKDFLCPRCRKYIPDLAIEKMEKALPKQFVTKPVYSKLKGKGGVKKKRSDISREKDKIQLTKGEYLKLLGIVSLDRTELFCSNNNLAYLLELANNLDLIAVKVLGGELDKMHLISEEDNTEEKCQFYVKDEIIYLAYGNFPDKKGKWLLEQMSINFVDIKDDLVGKKDVNQLNKIEINEIQYEFKKRTNFILKEYLKLQEVFPDQDLRYVEDTIRILYLGLSSMSIGVISLLLGDELVSKLQMKLENPEEERELKESMITARIEAIAANTQGNTGAIPRWVAVKCGFQQYRFITFKKYKNDFFLSLITEGNLGKVEQVERLLETKITEASNTPFSGNLKPFNKLRQDLEKKLKKRRKFPPFNFNVKLKEKKNTEVMESEDVKPEDRRYCMYCGSKLMKNNNNCSVCGTMIED